ncbi:MAG: putative porin [Bacteroidia bacterium]
MNSANKIIFFLFFLSTSLFSFNSDSLQSFKKNSAVKFYTQNQFENKDSVSYLENTLDNFQHYQNKNNLGNLGLPFNDLIFKSNSSSFGFNFFKNNYGDNFFTFNKLFFYNTHTPFTDLLYVMSNKAEQFFKMSFSYNVKKNWNVTANFSSINSKGFYNRQKTADYFMGLSTNYKSLNNRYYLLAAVLYNKTVNEENGGIKKDSAFENSPRPLSKQGVPINLLSAKNSMRNRSINLKQYYNIGKRLNDSAQVISTSQFSLSSSYEDYSFLYRDDYIDNVNFYPHIYFNDTKTHDSTYYSKVENQLRWKTVDNKKHRGVKDMIGFGVDITHQFIKIAQPDKDTIFSPYNTQFHYFLKKYNNFSIGGSVFNRYTNHKLWLNASANYMVSGYNKGDYKLNFLLKKEVVDSNNILFLSVENNLIEPDYIYSHYSSNHFKWNNDFNKMQALKISANFSMKKYNFMVGGSIAQYSNFTYLNEEITASQYNGVIPLYTAFINKDFELYNWHLTNSITYQHVPDSAVIRVPEFITENSLYYQHNIFKAAALVQIGFSVFYNSAYYSNEYMPAISQFYLQNKKKYGNYPFLDFFINAKIKMVKLFFKIDHLNSEISGNNYMLTPHYPLTGQSFKFGISWKFYD